MTGGLGPQGRVLKGRSRNGRTQVDRHAGRSRLRFKLPAPGPGGSLWKLGRAGEVCPGLCRGLDQGDEPRSLRPCVISPEGDLDRLFTIGGHRENVVVIPGAAADSGVDRWLDPPRPGSQSVTFGEPFKSAHHFSGLQGEPKPRGDPSGLRVVCQSTWASDGGSNPAFGTMARLNGISAIGRSPFFRLTNHL